MRRSATLVRVGLLTLAAVLFIERNPAQAVASLIAGVTAEASSEFYFPASPPYPEDDRRVVHIVDGSGLDSGGAGTHFSADAATGTFWLSAPSTTATDQWVVFTLPGLYDLTSTKVWNYNEAPGYGYAARGVATMDVLVSSDGSSYTNLGSRSVSVAPGDSVTPFGDTLPLSVTGVRYVKFDISTALDSTSYVGLSEVQFFGSPVPEPSTLVLLAAGAITLLAYAWRKRK